MLRNHVRGPRPRRSGRLRLQPPLALLLALTVALVVVAAPGSSTPLHAQASWLDIVNGYRALANLPALTENPTFSDGASRPPAVTR